MIGMRRVPLTSDFSHNICESMLPFKNYGACFLSHFIIRGTDTYPTPPCSKLRNFVSFRTVIKKAGGYASRMHRSFGRGSEIHSFKDCRKLGKLLPPEVDRYHRVPQRQLESDEVSIVCGRAVDVGKLIASILHISSFLRQSRKWFVMI